mgnify:FL=1
MASYTNTERPSVEKFFNLFEKLLRIRITNYIRTHHADYEARFLNQFFVVAYDAVDFDTDMLRDTYIAKKHFEENLNIKFTQVELDMVSLDDNRDTVYHLSCYPDFLEEDYDGDYFRFGFGKDGLSIEGKHQFDNLHITSDEQWEVINKRIEQELYFDTLR